MIDLRSDTVTRPTSGMRAAIAAAAVGDDVYEDDPTVNALQAQVAKLLGKEEGLFMASGTQSNLCAMLAHCQRGEEVLTGEQYHVFSDEAGGAAVLGGIMLAPMPTDRRGALSPDSIDATVKPDDSHCPISRLLVLENTVSGYVQSIGQMEACAARARRHGLAVHVDGARLMNAAVFLGAAPADLVASADSVSLCLSKGLGAPAGTVLAGSAALIARARRWRKMLGGGLRQAGLLAAAGIYALEHHVERLAEDHANARRLAERLAAIKTIAVAPDEVETNMVFARLPVEQDAAVADKLRAHMAARGVLLGDGRRQLRLVTHLDIGRGDVDAVAEGMQAFF